MQGSHVEEIKSRLPIDELVGSYITLERKGKYLSARCPFHNEKSGSFYVSPDRGTYYCFGCGEKGDIFSFVEKYEGLDFRGALSELARRTGVELVPVSKESIDRKEKIYMCLAQSAKYFEENLLKNPEALKYVTDRTVTNETISKFRIGYSLPDWSGLTNNLKQNGFEDEIIISAGLGIMGDKGLYDRFRGRIMFPIEDSAGRTVGYSGRILPAHDDGKSGKYINSPETEVYHKSNILYGFSHAKQFIRKHDFSILVEGQFDVVLSHQNGFPNTVAVSGTAFSGDVENETGNPTQLGLLSRLSKNIILALDSDDAGEKAKLRVISTSLPLGLSIKLIKNIPGSKDPADILSAPGGVETWKATLKESQPPVESLCRNIIDKKVDRETQINEVKKNIFPIIALLPSAVDRHESARIIEKYFSLPVDAVINDVENLIKNKPQENSEEQNIKKDDETKKINTTIKEKFWGIYYASELIEGPLKQYREKIHKWVLENIPEDIVKQDKSDTIERKEELSLPAEVDFLRSKENPAFIDDVSLQYEESVFRVIVSKVKEDLARNQNDINLITKYTELQKKIEIIKEKRRNI